MSEVVLTEQLDQAIEALLLEPDSRPADGVASERSELDQLLRIASDLRALPREAFKASLRVELAKEIETMMTTATEARVKPVQAEFRTVTPYLTVMDVPKVIEFIKSAFGAEGQIHGLGSAGGFHAEYRIGESMLMIGGGGEGASWKGPATPGTLHLYVEDVDEVYERALQAGATSLMAPTDQEYQDRDAAIQDVGGNQWYIATHKGAGYVPEGVHNLMPYLHPKGAPRMIDFLKQAFGAEELGVYKSPDGIVQHAAIKIGNSVVEMGEAHGEWQARPMHFMLYVDDVDTWYARAIQVPDVVAVNPPANQSYGDRVGTIKDPFENVWYLASHISNA